MVAVPFHGMLINICAIGLPRTKRAVNRFILRYYPRHVSITKQVVER